METPNLFMFSYTLLFPRSSVRVACARTQVIFGPATPASAPVDRPMDTG